MPASCFLCPLGLEEARVDLDCKPDCKVDPESGVSYVVEADYRYDLTDVPPTLSGYFLRMRHLPE